MKDNLPVVWRAEPHTPAKHAILKRYLDAWIPILLRQSRRVKREPRNLVYRWLCRAGRIRKRRAREPRYRSYHSIAALSRFSCADTVSLYRGR